MKDVVNICGKREIYNYTEFGWMLVEWKQIRNTEFEGACQSQQCHQQAAQSVPPMDLIEERSGLILSLMSVSAYKIQLWNSNKHTFEC
jgi:hypothetical protein